MLKMMAKIEKSAADFRGCQVAKMHKYVAQMHKTYGVINTF